MLFTGGINDGAADALEQALRKTPGATTVVLRSEGGWLREGTLVAAVIRRHRLHTYVERTCASACTIAFLAGDDRAAAPGARIGFHRPRAIGADQDQAPGATDSALWSAYAAAGLPDAFVRHVQATPFDAIWFPTDRELLDNGVVTRASSGGEYATMATLLTTREALSAELRAAPLYATLERKYPAHFKSLLDNIWPALQRHASDAEIIAQLRAQSSRLYRVLLPTAPDALLLANARLTIDQAQTLQRISPEACGLPDGTAGPGTIAARLPGALLTREQALFSDLVQAADPEHAPMVTRAQAMPALQLAIAALPAQEQRVLTFPDTASHRAGRRALPRLDRLCPGHPVAARRRSRARPARHLRPDVRTGCVSPHAGEWPQACGHAARDNRDRFSALMARASGLYEWMAPYDTNAESQALNIPPHPPPANARRNVSAWSSRCPLTDWPTALRSRRDALVATLPRGQPPLTGRHKRPSHARIPR